MLKQNVVNLVNWSRPEIQIWLQTFDVVLTDCDGVLWHDNNVISGSPQVINALKALGKRIYFVTNNGTKTRHEIWQRAHGMGFEIAETDIIAPTFSIAEYLQQCNFKKQAFVIGSSGIVQELNAAGIRNFGVGPDVIEGKINDYIAREIVTQQSDEIGAVIVGWDEHFSYGKMMKASNLLCAREDVHFLATNTDAVHKYPKYYIPGTGAILAALECCVGREAIVFGKPNPVICKTLLSEGKITPQRTLMIGDCCKIDVLFGKNCDFHTLLVGTGSYSMEAVHKLMENMQENHKYIPDFYLPQLGDLSKFM